MARYQFRCDNCDITRNVKWSFKEHSELKNDQRCNVCGGLEYQVVSQLNFRLAGEGWFGRDGGNNSSGVGYEITQNSMNKSKDDVAKLEDIANNYAEKQTGVL